MDKELKELLNRVEDVLPESVNVSQIIDLATVLIIKSALIMRERLSPIELAIERTRIIDNIAKNLDKNIEQSYKMMS